MADPRNAASRVEQQTSDHLPPDQTTDQNRASPDQTTDQNLTTGHVPEANAVEEAVPGYEILGELGRGGMGVVFKARQLAANRLVALKMVLSGSLSGSAERERFRTEAEAVARLQHPNIVQLFDAGEHAGTPYFSLELCPGGALDQRLKGDPMPALAAAELVSRIADGVAAAHAKGIIHRDLKPANVLLAEDGTPKVTDFGLAKKLDEESSQTRTNAVMGTPSYMAPEQAMGDTRNVGPACDVYSLGAILYEAVTGRAPFRGATVLETLDQVRKQEPVPPRQLNATVPRDLETICLKCLQKQSGRRYATARELAEDLDRFLSGRPIAARPVGPVEKGWKWCRRNPAVAASLAAFGLAIAAVITTLLVSDRAIRETNTALTQTNADLDRERSNLNQANRQLATERATLADANVALTKAIADEQAATRAARRRAYNLGMFIADREAQAKNIDAAERHLEGLPEELRNWEWHFLKKQLRAGYTEIQVTPTETSPLHGLSFSPDGSQLIAWARNGDSKNPIGYVREFALPSGNMLREWKPEPIEKPGWRNSCLIHAVRSDGKRALLTTYRIPPPPKPGERPQERTTDYQVIDTDTGKVVATLKPPEMRGMRGLPPTPMKLEGFSLGGKLVYATINEPGLPGKRTERVACFNAESGELESSWVAPEGLSTFHTAFDENSEFLILSPATLGARPKGPVPPPECVVVKSTTGEEVSRIKVIPNETTPDLMRCVTPMGTVLFGGRTKTREFRLQTGEQVRELPFPNATNIAVDPTGTRMTITTGTRVNIIDIKTGEAVGEAPVLGSGGASRTNPISRDGWQALGRYRGAVVLYQLDHVTQSGKLRLPSVTDRSPDERYLVHEIPDVRKPPGQLRFYSLPSGKPIGEIDYPLRDAQPKGQAALTASQLLGPNGGFVAVVQDPEASTCRAYRVEEVGVRLVGEYRFTKPIHYTLALAMDSRGRVVLYAEEQETTPPPEKRPGVTGTIRVRGRLLVWDPAAGQEPLLLAETSYTGPLGKLPTPEKFGQAAFTNDDRSLAVAFCRPGKEPGKFELGVHLWDATTWNRRESIPLRVQEKHQVPNTLKFSPDGQLLFARLWGEAGEPAVTTLIDVPSGQVRPADRWSGPVPVPQAFSHDGRYVAGRIDEGGTALLGVWDIASGKRLWSVAGIYTHSVFLGSLGRLAAVRQSAGQEVSHTLDVFDAQDGQELLSIPAAVSNGLAFDQAEGLLRLYSTYMNGPGTSNSQANGVLSFDGSPRPAKP